MKNLVINNLKKVVTEDVKCDVEFDFMQYYVNDNDTVYIHNTNIHIISCRFPEKYDRTTIINKSNKIVINFYLKNVLIKFIELVPYDKKYFSVLMKLTNPYHVYAEDAFDIKNEMHIVKLLKELLNNSFVEEYNELFFRYTDALKRW